MVSMDKMQVVLANARKALCPQSLKLKSVEDLVSSVNALLKKAKLSAVCTPGGSYAKGVILRDDFDVDLFVRFSYSYKDEDISRLLGKALSPLKPVLVHGSRDYFHLRKEGVLFELIPVIRISDFRKAVNVTDMSPLHVDYANKQFNKNPGLRDEVRLAKQFCKAAKVYGAESFIRGFSGHVLDLLIIYYGSFEKFIMQASVWGERVVVDLEKHWKDPLSELNSSKTVSPLIVVDPLQPDRNAAAAISVEKFEALKKTARAFIHGPSPNFFTIKKLDFSELKKKAGHDWLVIAEAVPFEGKDDVVYTKALRVHELFLSSLKKHDFDVLSAGWEHGRTCTSYFIIKKENLSPMIVKRGPPVSDLENCTAFKKVHKHTIPRGGVLYAKEPREFVEPLALLRSISRGKFARDKIKSISFS